MNILRINDGEYEIPYKSFQEEYVRNDDSVEVSLTVWLFDINDIPNIETFYFTDINKIQLYQNDKEVYVTDKYPEVSHILFTSNPEVEEEEYDNELGIKVPEFSANILFAIRIYKDGSHKSLTSSYYKTPTFSDFEDNEDLSSCTTLCSSNCIGVCTALCTINSAGENEE